MRKSATLVCDAAIKLKKLLYADAKLGSVADYCVAAVVVVKVIRRTRCAKTVKMILREVMQRFDFVRM
jgi:hypothetical protein